MKSLFDSDRWQEIWITITHNKSRSFLTAFGVFWGIFMLVLMVGAGNALDQGIRSQIDGFASNSSIIWSNRTTLPYKGLKKDRWWNMVNSDIPIIESRVPEIEHISPIIFSGGGGNNNVFYGEKGGSYSIKGCYPNYNYIETSLMLNGRFVNDIDVAEQRKVCVIGDRIAEVLFTNVDDAIDKLIKVNGIYFRVIGVAKALATGASIGWPISESVVLPFTTMQKAFNQGNIIHNLAITSMPGIRIKVVQDKVSDVIKDIHQISPDDNDAVGAVNIEEQFDMFNNLFLGISSLIWIVGLGTLFAGAIGVSNIMLVTVRERTKEIGIRRALGATPQNIIGQILSESIILTLIAGVGGIVLGVGILSGVGVALSQGDQFFKDPQISFNMAISALSILAVIGTLAGFIPAQRAMMIKPVEAISEE